MSKSIVEQMDPIFKPRSVAVIGASNKPGRWGYNTMQRLVRTSYQGAIFPVNPNEREILGIPAYSTITDVPGPVDLAVVIIPAPLVPAVMAECVRAGVRGAVVISAGFAELSAEGMALQEELVRIVRAGGIRMVGPNCVGLSSAAGGLSLAGTERSMPGPVALISQSGALGGMLASQAEEKGYGLSAFVSSGNQADLNEADYVEYLAKDPNTRVIALYVEGFRAGRRFLDVAREVVPQKPIVVYKAGRNPVGERAVHSHTGSLMMRDDLFDALCDQIGLIRVAEINHLMDVAEVLAKALLPPGPGVGIVSMTGGGGVIASDTCAHLGLEVPELDQETRDYLKAEVMAPHVPAPRNPADIAGDFRSPLIFAELAEALARLDYINTLIVGPPSGRGRASSDAEEAARRIAAIPGEYGKPVIILGRVSGPIDSHVRAIFDEAGLPRYETPEDAARAAYALMRYAQIRGM